MHLIEQILLEEEEGKNGANILFERYQNRLPKIEWDLDLETQYLFQGFKLRVAYRYITNLNFVKARLVFASIVGVLKDLKKSYLGHRIYHEALLGLAECEIQFHRPVRSEIILKQELDVVYIQSRRRFSNLSYESNGQYWAQKIRPFNGFALLFLLIGIVFQIKPFDQTFSWFQTFSWIRVFFWIGLVILIGLRLYRMLNQDRVSLDFLEIIVVRNGFREMLNEQFNWNLGYQKELDRGFGQDENY